VEGNELNKLKKPTKQKQKLTHQRKREEKIEFFFQQTTYSTDEY